MLPTSSRLAASVSTGPLKLKAASAQLLPPLSLYRRLLRSHRRLPEDMRFMGDAYIKSEFRRTKTTDNPIHIIGFLSQWKLYLDEVEAETAKANGTEDVWRGRRMSEETFEKLSNEQAGQLYELMHATKDVWKTPEELEAQAAQQELDDANAASEGSDSGKKAS